MDEQATALAYPTDEQVDEVLAEFGGDHRKAIAALLHDFNALASDYEAAVSHGFIRAVSPAATRTA